MSCSNEAMVFNIMVNDDKLSNGHKYDSRYKYGFGYEYGVRNEYSIGNEYRYDSRHEYGIGHEYENITEDANDDYKIQKVFNSWDVAIEEIEKYACRKGFGTRRLRVEKLDNSDIRRYTIVCEHFDRPEQTKNKNPQNKTTSKRIGFDKNKNHELNPPYRTFQESLKFSEKMFKDIEFYVKKMNCKIQRFCPKLRDQTNNAACLYEELLKKKEKNPCWYMTLDWNPNTKCLR
ncbi:18927_t:CDS:2, partial [Racocetra persica]